MALETHLQPSFLRKHSPEELVFARYVKQDNDPEGSYEHRAAQWLASITDLPSGNTVMPVDQEAEDHVVNTTQALFEKELELAGLDKDNLPPSYKAMYNIFTASQDPENRHYDLARFTIFNGIARAFHNHKTASSLPGEHILSDDEVEGTAYKLIPYQQKYSQKLPRVRKIPRNK